MSQIIKIAALSAISIGANFVSAEDAAKTERLLALRLHHRARDAFRQFIKKLPADALKPLAYKELYVRHPYFAELCTERMAEINGESTDSIVDLALAKLSYGKVEAAELLVTPLRNSSKESVRAEFEKSIHARLEQCKVQEWNRPSLQKRAIADLQLLSGNYNDARENYQQFGTEVSKTPRAAICQPYVIWCEAKTNSSSIPIASNGHRTAQFALATILANQN